MATTADNKGVTGKQPVSAHPAFPAIVALWFAVLLGLGTLVVPAALLEQATSIIGLAKILPAAEPPLGMTARALTALVGTIFGALLGLVLARRIAATHSPSASRRSAGGCKPINALDELGNQGLDGALETKGKRRRSLALVNEDEKSDFLEQAPLPAGRVNAEEDTFDASDLDQPDVETLETDDDWLDLADVDEFNVLEDDNDLPPQTLVAAGDANPGEDTPDMAPALEADEAWVDADEGEFALDTESGKNEFALPATTMSFTAPTLAKAPVDGPSVAAEQLAAAKTKPRPAWAEAPLEDLGLVQLAQRLADSIERHREFRAARAAVAAGAAIPLQTPVEASAPEAIATDAEDDYFADAGMIDLESGRDDRDDSDEHTASFAAFSVAQPAETEEPVDTEAEAEADHDEDAGPSGAGESLFARLGGIPKAEEPAGEDAADADYPADEIDLAEERQVFEPTAPERDDEGYEPFAGFATPEDEGEHDDDSDIVASFSLPLGEKSRAPAIEDTSAEDLEDDETTDLTGYGSLLGKPNPFRDDAGEFVRIEDEPQDTDGLVKPTVVFPPQARVADAADTPEAAQPAAAPKTAADAEENERALREALLNLQRMSGAA